VHLPGRRWQSFRSAGQRFSVARQQKNFGAQFGECGSRCAAYSLGSATDNGALPGKGLLHAVKLARLARWLVGCVFLVPCFWWPPGDLTHSVITGFYFFSNFSKWICNCNSTNYLKYPFEKTSCEQPETNLASLAS
jgi:hypothetical protein